VAQPFSVRVLAWSDAQAGASAIREAVFVAEQGVPAEIELDEWDAQCEHALACDGSGRALGTGRLLPDGHIGRMAVLREWRGSGVGGAILEVLIDRARARGMTRVVLHAQTHAERFYSRFGFAVSGAEFMEAGISHGGGRRFGPEEIPYALLADWIGRGATNASGPPLTVTLGLPIAAEP
jgi:predicted GNAT family N-acyltransferase